MRSKPGVTRRGLLLGGPAALVAACAGRSAPVAAPPSAAPASSPSPLKASITIHRRHSAARGRDVDVVLMTPDGVPSTGLPVCVALHGRGANARTFLDLDLPAALTAAVRSGTPPFAVVAVDGSHYWMPDGGDDPHRMLTDELPGWLSESGLRPMAGLFGISMGGFGALNLARRRRDVTAVATCSAALFRTWPEARTRHVFASQDDWTAAEPLQHVDELPSRGLGVWCGDGDSFVAANRKLISTAHPEVARITPGKHTSEYWKGVLPEVLRFLGPRVA
ncbi:S-formylglutathione hydrolase FrmB [Amycolatopsis echigonensis]|uniref:Acyl-CoA:diacylglycerol acyltransferase n=1 Tax=Amycolatopsis echigonensis TaxID=2576905 RepID=A0A2N3WVK8_9PSEU|nr:alpha/beta hydrolase-fold protein [Amycolatopsis niigatensis]PKV97902.1 S-formylglutathione hydrolase FrmB [Amycolatopsis niigatensis]